MGKGDIKTAKGKRIAGSYGKTRKRKKATVSATPAKKKATVKKETTKKTATKAAPTAKAAAAKKPAAKKPATKKTED